MSRFAFVPEDGRPNRLIRWVEPGTLPGPRTLCVYDEVKNLLIIDKEKFATLDAFTKSRVLRTQQPVLFVGAADTETEELSDAALMKKIKRELGLDDAA